MEVDALKEFDIPSEFIEHFRKENINYLYPPQAEALRNGLLTQEKNFLLTFPTASGKTLNATLLAIKTIVEKKGKAIYIVPLVALANEKYAYYKSLFSNFKVALSVGDMDSPEPWLRDYDFIVATTEKLDSLIRHGITWLSQIKLIIADEVHLLNDYSRGPALEMVITQLRRLCPQARVLGLSATISNAEELSQWLEAELVRSDFRPVKLYEGINFESTIQFKDRKSYFLNDKLDAETAITENTLKSNKQILFFVSSRRNAEALAERLAQLTKKFTDSGEKRLLDGLEKQTLSALETPTHQCRRLARCIKEGSSFHHAGLLARQRKIIEDGFRQGWIKVVVATPTLSLGVNLPCFRVVVRDVKRYYPGLGSEYIPTLEYKQFAGRAGRPQYDKFGEAILIARSEREREELTERYINGEPEEINSKLAQESVLRMHILSLIASELCNTKGDLEDFFNSTFFGFQYRDASLLKEKINSVLEQLFNWHFIQNYSFFLKATRLGKRITQLYLDPLTAHNFIIALNAIPSLKEVSDLGLLVAVCVSREMFPPVTLRQDDMDRLNEFVAKQEELFINKPPQMWEENYEGFLSALKLALIFESWICEEDEEFILDKFKVTPGELHAKRELADWLLYSLGELAEIARLNDSRPQIKRLQVRIHYGVREELLELVSLKEIGRKRARRLFNAGLKNIAALRQAQEKDLAQILGPRITAVVKRQILLSRRP